MNWRNVLIRPKIVRRFEENQEGVTAVEFALVGGPFFFMLFFIVETSIFFFAGQYLESAVDDTARLFRTGQFNQTTTEQEFRKEFCARLNVFFNCDAVRTEVQVTTDFNKLQDPEALDKDGNLESNVFTASGPQEVIQVTAQYKWPVYTNFSAPLIDSFSDSGPSYSLMQALTVTRTEPFVSASATKP